MPFKAFPSMKYLLEIEKQELVTIRNCCHLYSPLNSHTKDPQAQAEPVLELREWIPLGEQASRKSKWQHYLSPAHLICRHTDFGILQE